MKSRVLLTNGEASLEISVSFEEALQIMGDMKPTLTTSPAYDALERLLMAATREARRAELAAQEGIQP